MKILIASCLLISVHATSMEPHPFQTAKDQPINEANKKQKKDAPLFVQQFNDAEVEDGFWDDIAPDHSHFFSDLKLERFKVGNLQPSPRSAIAIAQSMKSNPDGWPYDSDEANEIIKALESEEPERKDN